MPEEIESRLTVGCRDLIDQNGKFNFRLLEYPGKENPPTLIIYDPDNIIFYGQVRTLPEGKQIKEGKGYLFKNKSLYCGYFRDDKFEGPGLFVLHEETHDAYFFGFWVGDHLKGKGLVVHDSGYAYSGEWSDDLQNGYGEETWPDGSIYKGEFKKGKKCGKGELIWPNKAR